MANYTAVRALGRTAGRVVGAQLEDRLTGARAALRASVVVNATGPWADKIRVLEDSGAEVLITDADLSTPIEELDKLQAALDNGAGVAIGSRALRASRVEVSQPIYRVVMGKIFNLIVQAVLLPGIWDTQCGFKLFRADVAHSVFGSLVTDGFGFDPEVLYRARKQGVKIAEVPVVWRNSAPTTVSPVHSSIDMLKHVVRLRLRG